MAITHHEQLLAWQLANELKLTVYAFTARSEVKRDFSFCDQIRGSSSSAPSNIAEGFWRYAHPEFAHFVNIARGSLGETQNHLRHALDVGYLQRPEFESLWDLSTRAIATTTKLHEYLDTHATPRRPGHRSPRVARARRT